MSLVGFYGASLILGLGLGFLLGAPVRYIMLNESPPYERAIAQGSLSIFSSVGNLISGSLVGTIIFSAGGGIAAHSIAFVVIAGVMAVLLVISLALKGQAQEIAPALNLVQNPRVPCQNPAPRNIPGIH